MDPSIHTACFPLQYVSTEVPAVHTECLVPYQCAREKSLVFEHCKTGCEEERDALRNDDNTPKRNTLVELSAIPHMVILCESSQWLARGKNNVPIPTCVSIHVSATSDVASIRRVRTHQKERAKFRAKKISAPPSPKRLILQSVKVQKKHQLLVGLLKRLD